MSLSNEKLGAWRTIRQYKYDVHFGCTVYVQERWYDREYTCWNCYFSEMKNGNEQRILHKR
ncbi:hypothetical protein PV797_03685 [Clostridiaceae bacterium M8S5]|nr:hypothetical protein PV797_03685 [Clostridiaceae bacterium M8S5]